MSKIILKIYFKILRCLHPFTMVFIRFATDNMARRLFYILLLCSLGVAAMAQSDSTGTSEVCDEITVDTAEWAFSDSYGAAPMPMYVLKDPRQGLHFSLDMGVTASFGSSRYSGTGFFQRLSAMYETPLSDRISLSVGGFLQNMSWGGSSQQSAGVEARLNYMFSERLFGEIYYSKTVTPRYDIDRIGASLEYHFSPSFSMGISVEGARVNGNGSQRREPYYLNYW